MDFKSSRKEEQHLSDSVDTQHSLICCFAVRLRIGVLLFGSLCLFVLVSVSVLISPSMCLDDI